MRNFTERENLFTYADIILQIQSDNAVDTQVKWSLSSLNHKL